VTRATGIERIDAARPPSGHTLVTGTMGNRVFQGDRRGRVVWSVETNLDAYEAGRLSTPAGCRGVGARPA
jgi:hypothetical protein